jgi:hypothetical protein
MCPCRATTDCNGGGILPWGEVDGELEAAHKIHANPVCYCGKTALSRSQCLCVWRRGSCGSRVIARPIAFFHTTPTLLAQLFTFPNNIVLRRVASSSCVALPNTTTHKLIPPSPPPVTHCSYSTAMAAVAVVFATTHRGPRLARDQRPLSFAMASAAAAQPRLPSHSPRKQSICGADDGKITRHEGPFDLLHRRPEGLLRSCGWDSPDVTFSGEKRAHYGRWPFPAVPAFIPASLIPRFWLISAKATR